MLQHDRNKDLWIDHLDYGTHYDGFVAGLRDISGTDTHYDFTLYDRTGEIRGTIPKASVEEQPQKGVFSISMNVKMEKGVKIAVVKSITPATAGIHYNPMDIFRGISEETRMELIQRIKGAICEVAKCEKQNGGGHYKDLLLSYFSQNEVDILAKRPASVADAGRYMGGALHLIANVASLCSAARTASEGRLSAIPNGLYDVQTDFPLMLTACLLCMAGMKEYVGDDMNKTQKGEIRGYHSLLQSRIEPLFAETGVTPLEGDKLLNTLQCMFPGVGALKSITLESSVCRACLSLYKEMDQIAAYLSEVPAVEDVRKGFRYSESLRRPFLIVPEGGAEDVS